MKLLLASALSALIGTSTGAFVSSGVNAAPVAADMPMTEYLALLGQIAPAAQEGATAYTRAFEARCGRPMTSTQLRRALSEGSGDPLLMAMMRAAHLRDTVTLAQLRQQIPCTPPGGQP